MTSRITGDMALIQDGISQKVGLTLTGLTTFVAALVVAFIKSWKLAFIMLSGVFAMMLAMGGIGGFMKKIQAQAIDAASANSTLAEEAVTAVRNVTAFGAQDRMASKYEKQGIQTTILDVKAKGLLGIMIATTICIMNFLYGLGFWQGGRFIHWGDASVSQVLTLLLASLLAGVGFGHIA